MYVGLDGDEIVCGHLGEYQKVKNVSRDAQVALSIEAAGEAGPGFGHCRCKCRAWIVGGVRNHAFVVRI